MARGVSVFTSQWELQKASVCPHTSASAPRKTNTAAVVWRKLAFRKRCRHFNQTSINLLLSYFHTKAPSLEYVCIGTSQMWTHTWTNAVVLQVRTEAKLYLLRSTWSTLTTCFSLITGWDSKFCLDPHIVTYWQNFEFHPSGNNQMVKIWLRWKNEKMRQIWWHQQKKMPLLL